MYNDLSDSNLIQRLAVSTDEEKNRIFLTLYDRYKNLVLKIAFHYVKDYERAGDLMHDVFLRVIQSVDRLKQPDLFKSWLMTITRNICVDSLRKTSYLMNQDFLDASIEVVSSDRVEDKVIAGIDRQKILSSLRACIQCLGEFELNVFKLRWQGLRAAQICKILAAEKSQVRRSYDKIKRALEACMERKGLKISIDQMMYLGEIDDEG